jgi:hypothetical protein
MTKHLVRLQVAATTRAAGDRGQGALEYVGIVLIIAVLTAGVIGIFNGQVSTITGRVTSAIAQFLSAPAS